MNFAFQQKWNDFVKEISVNFDERLDLNSILFMIGMQELNKGYLKLSKDQKLEVMHIGVCSVLQAYGFYKFVGRDEDGWPHFESIKKIPHLNGEEQQQFLKQAIMDYFTIYGQA